MPNPEHQKAQELAALAGLRLREGDLISARRMYAEAADLEQQAFEKIPQDKTRTRSILGVSFASLLYKAQQFDAAEVELYKLLTATDLTAAARRQLRELGKMAAERAAAAVRRKNRKYSPPVREFLRRGGRNVSKDAVIRTRDLPRCYYCGADAGHPCRTDRGRVTRPHAVRKVHYHKDRDLAKMIAARLKDNDRTKGDAP